MITVGIDLSLASTGLAIIDQDVTPCEIRTHRIRSAGKADDALSTRHRRLRRIVREIDDTIDYTICLDQVVIEGPAYSQALQRGVFDRSGLWWIIVDLFLTAGVPVAVVPPNSRAMYATGRGNASKDAVLAAVIKRYPTVPVDGNDVADALVLAAIGARRLGQAIDDLPETHLRAMKAVHG